MNAIVVEFLRRSKVLALNGTDLNNPHNFFCLVKSLEEEELSKEKCIFNFEHCKLGYKNIESLFAALAANITHAFHLRFSWNNLGEKGMVPVSKLFHPISNVTRLYLDGNGIGDMGVQSLLRAMEESDSRVTHLSLALNGIGKEGMSCLADTFEGALRAIESLNISQNDLSCEVVVEKLAKSFKNSATLEDLNLASSRLGWKGVSAIAHIVITDNYVLKCIDLTNNDMRDGGANALSLSLECNDVLSRLFVGSNNISPSGCAFFVNCLEVNCTLRELDLSRTHSNQLPLGIEGARQIALMLRVNRSLTYLNLYWCMIESAGAEFIASALGKNKVIEKINLGGNFIGPEGIRKLEEYMSPVYSPSDDSFNMSSWNNNSPCTPLLLNRRSGVTAKRPKSAAAKLSRMNTPATKRDTINVKSRMSVLLSGPVKLRPQSCGPRSKFSATKLFAITPAVTRESNALLPEIRQSLNLVDAVVGKDRAIAKASPRRLLENNSNNWVNGSVGSKVNRNKRAISPIRLMFNL